MGVIFALSSRSGGQLDRWLPWFQAWLPGLTSFNPMHYAAYFILALTVAYALGPKSAGWAGGFAVLAVCVLYGATDEWHQMYVPMRTPDASDLLHDGIGAAAAVLLLALWRRLRHRRSSRNYSRL
jgi:VanZ family protein